MIRVLLGLAIAAIASSTASAQYINPSNWQANQYMMQQVMQQQYQMQMAYRFNPQYRAYVDQQNRLEAFDRMNAQTGTIQFSGTNGFLQYEVGGLGGMTIRDRAYRPLMMIRPDNSPLNEVRF